MPPTTVSTRTCRTASFRSRRSGTRVGRRRSAGRVHSRRAGRPFVVHGDASKLTSSDYDIPGFARTPVEPGDPKGFVPNSRPSRRRARPARSATSECRLHRRLLLRVQHLYGSPAEEEVQSISPNAASTCGTAHHALRVPARGEVALWQERLSARRGRRRYERHDLHRQGLGGPAGAAPSAPGSSDGRLWRPDPAPRPRGGGRRRFIPPTSTDAQGLFLSKRPRSERRCACSRVPLGASGVDSPETPESRAAPSTATRARSASSGPLRPDGVLGARVRARRSAHRAGALRRRAAHRDARVRDRRPVPRHEISTGVDVVLRRTEGIVSGSVAFFYNSFQRFHLRAVHGRSHGRSAVIRYTQLDARFLGGEGHLDVELFHADPHHLALELVGDYVRAELRPSDEPLPRIPPLRYGAGLRYQSPSLERLSSRSGGSMRQDRVAPFETTTAGYTMLNARSDIGSSSGR